MHGLPALRGITVADDPDDWRAAGFEVAEDRLTVGGVTILLAGRDAGPDGARGVLGWSLEHPAPTDADGLRHLPVPAPADEIAHPNGTVALDHVVAATPDVGRTVTALGSLGVVPRRTVDAVRGDAGTRYTFFLLTTSVLELIGPAEPDGDDPARFVGLAFTVTDVDALGAWCPPPRDAIQPGRRITTLPHRDLGMSVPVAFLSPRARPTDAVTPGRRDGLRHLRPPGHEV